MATLKTDKGQTLEVVDVATAYNDTCVIQTQDKRRVPPIAEDYDGIHAMTFDDPLRGITREYSGYSELCSVIKDAYMGITQIILRKEADV
jgi:hypothetical protein